MGERPWIALRPGDDGRAIRPVVDDRDAAGIGALPATSRSRIVSPTATTRSARAMSRRVTRSSSRSTRVAPEVAEEARHLGEYVLAEVDEARARAAGARESGQADDRRIRQRDDHVGPGHREPGQAGRSEEAQVVRRARGKARRPERRAPRAQDPHAVSLLAPEREAPTAPGRGRRAARRRPGSGGPATTQTSWRPSRARSSARSVRSWPVAPWSG